MVQDNTIEWPKFWSPTYQAPLLQSWDSEAPQEQRHKNIQYATQFAMVELDNIDPNTGKWKQK